MKEAIDRAKMLMATMEGWCTPEKCEQLVTMVLEHNLRNAVEIGVFGGKSLVAIACAMALRGGGRVVGVDPYEVALCLEGGNDPANNEWWAKLDLNQIYFGAVRVLRSEKLDAYARIWPITSVQAARVYDPGTIDLLHLDGNHSHESTTADYEAWVPKVRAGGYIFMDDTHWPTLSRVMERAKSELEEVSETRLESEAGVQQWTILRKK